MGRTPRSIDNPRGPVGRLAVQLRERKDKAGLTYRGISTRRHCSRTSIAKAANGVDFPTWLTMENFVLGCGADTNEVAVWKARWEATRDELLAMHRSIGNVRWITPVRTVDGQAQGSRLRQVEPELARGDEWRPCPQNAFTFADLAYELTLLKGAAGGPSLRALMAEMASGRAVATAHKDWATYTSLARLSQLFAGTLNRPAFELVRYVVHVLLWRLQRPGPDNAEPWAQLEPWLEAWRRANFNATRPDLTRHRRYGPVLLVTNHDPNPTAAVIAAMEPPVAAATLAGMPDTLAAAIISDMPTGRAQAVIAAMHSLTNPTPDGDGAPQNGHPPRPTRRPAS